MVTVHVALEPDRDATTEASSVMVVTLGISNTLAVTEQTITSFDGSDDTTLMVRLNTNFPVVGEMAAAADA
jgi:hypothetical protein